MLKLFNSLSSNFCVFIIKLISNGQMESDQSNPATVLSHPQVWPQGSEQMRNFWMPQHTCTDSDSANKLLPPAAAPHHQSKVGLLDQLVHCALQMEKKRQRKQKRNTFTGNAATKETMM